MLRFAVNHVRDQCARGDRRLTNEQARQLVAAAGRALLAGF
jgi:hypothetical protein